LCERHQPVLAIGNPSDLSIPRQTNNPPTGLGVSYLSTLRPVGGLLGGAAGHGATLADAGARVVR